MDWFYNSVLFKTQKSKDKNQIGQLIETYLKTTNFKADVQPVEAASVKKTFGEDVECDFMVYCDEPLEVSNIVIYKGKPYEVKKIKPWDYTIAAIHQVDLNVS